MSNIDKQALRQIAESIDREEWDVLDNGDADYQVIVSGSLERGPTYRSYQPVTNEISNKKIAAFIAAFNPKVALALLDENLQLQREKDATEAVALALRDDMRQAREQLEAAEKRIADGSKRIAELENSETQLINERDAAESALADMYQAATGERPEWSNMFGFADAVDVVEERLATLEANQSQTTPTGIQFITEAIGAHGYIVGCLLQGRPDLALEESRKWVSAFGQAAEIVSAQDAAGIKVKGE
ncbi:ead/Ea22-like family protein [Salmonella enterica]|nr:ead/Ea22-like family protein [Salmonella enterica]ELJ2775742.1 ead/Ea22-like family protein [Salmonella enterica subsp. enterica]EEH8498306.1 ead/Ea22-like family protein [Salmonella enterica]EGP1377321.1 ead/Ea22-like family protein [Salmonella enterica]EGV1321054.1 ead/Ea22-like family protein [Salmonella enterica]